jgi:hypothetical protein
MPWIIGIDSDGLAQFPVIASRTDLDGDFSRPAGGDGPIEVGNSTASARADLSDSKGLITRVSNAKAVGHNRAFIHFLEVEVLLINDHLRSCGVPEQRDSDECRETK